VAGTEAGAAGLAAFGYTQELHRSLRFRDLLVYGLVFMAPTAPFAIFGPVFNTSKGMVSLTYVIGLVAMIFTALSYREMSRAFPISGSVYSYAGRGLAAPVGFFAGWAILLDYLLIPTLLYVTGAAAMAAIIPAVPQVAWVVIFVVINTGVNMAGIETTKRVNKLFLAGLLAVLAAFLILAVIGVLHGAGGAHWSAAPFYDPKVFHPSLVFGAVSVAALSFLGFDAISTLAEEVKGGARVVGRATVASLVIVATLFVAQTYLAVLLVPGKTHFVGNTAINDAFYHIATLIGGTPFKVVVALTVALSAALADSLVAQAATSRLLYSMSRDRQLPRFLAKVHPRRKVPERAVLLVGVLSVILGTAFVGQIDLLASLVNFGALVSFLILHVTVAVYYLIRERQHSFGMHLLVPVIGFAVIAYVLYNADLHAKIGGGIWLVIGVGIIVYRKATGRPISLAGQR
jgi:amino acid transporter